MKKKYLELMSKALGAYTDEHIIDYFNRVKAEGLTEHGFPRLTVNIGVLIAHGYRSELAPLFVEMMDFCCESIPKVKAANDFSVREIAFCLMELENCGMFLSDIERWKKDLSTIEPHKCYDKYALEPDDVVNNWALFSALSEFAREKLIGCDSDDFIDLQLENQLKRLDENGMYMDNLKHDAHQPIIYDLVPRFLLCLLMHFGYNGRHSERIDSLLKSTALMTLSMQSVTGEVAFGGRSNQFVHNEGMLAIIFEYEANRYAREGNLELAGKFKAAIARAMQMTEHWLGKKPIRHIKNRFDTETSYGCEKYAYFDKYMITTASHIFSAYMICDDEIEAGEFDDSPATFETSAHFHKLFLRAGGYFAEFDTNADPHYDSSALGRIHRFGAPSAICMTLPCSDAPKYKLCSDERYRASLCPGTIKDGKPFFACESDESVEVLSHGHGDSFAKASLRYIGDLTADYLVNANGVEIKVKGDGKVLHLLPAFAFDGEKETEIGISENALDVGYEGWLCRYTVSGKIKETDKLAKNRSGYYKLCYAEGDGELTVKIEIFKKD